MTTGTLGSLRELNRLRVVDAFRRHQVASRTDIVRWTGLSRTTVTGVISDLLARGLVVEVADDVHPDPVGRGRPPILLRLDASAGVAVGIDVGHSHVRAALADLSLTVLAERVVELDVDDDAPRALNAARTLIDEMLDVAQIGRERVVGVGLGIPAPVDTRSGIIFSSRILPGWVGMRPGFELSRRLDLHVDVENDANLGAIAESALGAGRGLSDMIYVELSSGIGAGFILGGRLHRGATGIAGELGHVQVRLGGAVCRCGNRGCLETIASVDAVLSLLEPTLGTTLSINGLIERIRAGDHGARRVVNDAGRAVGRVLADMCVALNPSTIVVGGELSKAGEPLLDGIREAIDRYALPGAAAVEVVGGVLGERAQVLGALALVVGDAANLRSAGLAAVQSDGALPSLS